MKKKVADPSFREPLPFESAKYKRITKADCEITSMRLGYLNENVYVANSKGVIEVLKYDLSEVIRTVQCFDKSINSMTFSKHYDFLCATSGIFVKVFDPKTFEVVSEIRGEFPVNCAQVSPLIYKKENPRFHLIMGGGVIARDTADTKEGGLEIYIMNLVHGSQVTTVSGHYGPINWIECCPDGSGFVSAGEESIVRYYRFDKSYFESEKYE